MIDIAMRICETADILVIIGTSMQVYPAAGLMHYFPDNTPAFYIDPKPALSNRKNLNVISESATIGIKKLKQLI